MDIFRQGSQMRCGGPLNQWCLFGFDVDRKAMRTFVLARLSKPALTGKRFPNPSNFRNAANTSRPTQSVLFPAD